MSGPITKDMRSNYSVYCANLRAKHQEPVSFDEWINDYVQALKEHLRDALIKADELDSLKNDPKYSYAGFPIPRAAIEARNAEIDDLRNQLVNVTDRAMRNIMDERNRQDKKWGEQNHDPYTYLAILLEEVGEYAQACLQTQFGGDKGGFFKMRDEAVHVAAVALAIIECLDRDKWSWPGGDHA